MIEEVQALGRRTPGVGPLFGLTPLGRRHGWTRPHYYLFERRQVAGAVPNTFLNARENAASES